MLHRNRGLVGERQLIKPETLAGDLGGSWPRAARATAWDFDVVEVNDQQQGVRIRHAVAGHIAFRRFEEDRSACPADVRVRRNANTAIPERAVASHRRDIFRADGKHAVAMPSDVSAKSQFAGIHCTASIITYPSHRHADNRRFPKSKYQRDEILVLFRRSPAGRSSVFFARQRGVPRRLLFSTSGRRSPCRRVELGPS